jgi:hypothetical protein
MHLMRLESVVVINVRVISAPWVKHIQVAYIEKRNYTVIWQNWLPSGELPWHPGGSWVRKIGAGLSPESFRGKIMHFGSFKVSKNNAFLKGGGIFLENTKN